MIPYSSLTFIQKNFRRGGFADIHIAVWDGSKIAVKAQTKHPSDIIREVSILQRVKNHSKFVEFCGIARYFTTSNARFGCYNRLQIQIIKYWFYTL